MSSRCCSNMLMAALIPVLIATAGVFASSGSARRSRGLTQTEIKHLYGGDFYHRMCAQKQGCAAAGPECEDIDIFSCDNVNGEVSYAGNTLDCSFDCGGCGIHCSESGVHVCHEVFECAASVFPPACYPAILDSSVNAPNSCTMY